MSDAKSVLAALAKAGVNVQRLSADSRRVNPGDVFVAMKGHHSDGRDYLAEAKAKGATAVIYEAGKTPVGAGDTPLVVATDIAGFIGELASEIYGHPSQKTLACRSHRNQRQDFGISMACAITEPIERPLCGYRDIGQWLSRCLGR